MAQPPAPVPPGCDDDGQSTAQDMIRVHRGVARTPGRGQGTIRVHRGMARTPGAARVQSGYIGVWPDTRARPGYIGVWPGHNRHDYRHKQVVSVANTKQQHL